MKTNETTVIENETSTSTLYLMGEVPAKAVWRGEGYVTPSEFQVEIASDRGRMFITPTGVTFGHPAYRMGQMAIAQMIGPFLVRVIFPAGDIWSRPVEMEGRLVPFRVVEDCYTE